MSSVEDFSTSSFQAVASKLTSRLQAPDSHELVMDMKSEIHVIITHEQFHRFMAAVENVGLAESTQ